MVAEGQDELDSAGALAPCSRNIGARASLPKSLTDKGSNLSRLGGNEWRHIASIRQSRCRCIFGGGYPEMLRSWTPSNSFYMWLAPLTLWMAWIKVLEMWVDVVSWWSVWPWASLEKHIRGGNSRRDRRREVLVGSMPCPSLQWDHVAWLGPRLTKVTMRRRGSPTTSMVVRFNLFTTVDASDLAFVVARWFWGGTMC